MAVPMGACRRKGLAGTQDSLGTATEGHTAYSCSVRAQTTATPTPETRTIRGSCVLPDDEGPLMLILIPRCADQQHQRLRYTRLTMRHIHSHGNAMRNAPAGIQYGHFADSARKVGPCPSEGLAAWIALGKSWQLSLSRLLGQDIGCAITS